MTTSPLHIVPFSKIKPGWSEFLGLGGIYGIRHTESHSVYVGMTNSLSARLLGHVGSMLKGKHHNLPLAAAVKKYGTGAFHFEILEIVDSSISRFEMHRKECEWVASELGRNHVYNGINDLPANKIAWDASLDVRFPDADTFQRFASLSAIERGKLIAAALPVAPASAEAEA